MWVEIVDVHLHAWLLCRCWGSKLGFSCLHSNHFYSISHLTISNKQSLNSHTQEFRRHNLLMSKTDLLGVELGLVEEELRNKHGS